MQNACTDGFCVIMQKLCCISCSESDLPDIEVQITCPITCCVENRITRSLSRRSSHGKEIERRVLQQSASSELWINSQIEQSNGNRERKGESLAEETAHVYTTRPS